MATITLQPKKRRVFPPDGVVRTEVVIGIHKVTFNTNFNMPNPDMNIIWQPGRPAGAEFVPKLQRIFERTRMQHLQKCADVSQKPVTVLTTETIRVLKNIAENPEP